MKFQVVVGNLGTVFSGNDEESAHECFGEYCGLSSDDYGRCGGETVTLMCDGVIWEEFNPSEREDSEDAEYEMPYSDIDLNEVCNHLAQITKEFWEAHRRSRPKAEIDRLEAEVTRLNKIIRGV